MTNGGSAADAPQWWQTRTFVLLAALASMVPLLWPDIPPLVDLPGHMARYRVQLDWDTIPWFSEWYRFEWQLIGNLGVDLLVELLAPVLGLELAVKLIVLAIPPLTVVGLLWIAREVHGRIPATALFALPFAYSYPFQFGFVNFALSMALALNAFALWLRLARLGRFRLRNWLFVPLSFLIWLTHTFGWGVLGVLAFSAELIRQHDQRSGWVKPWFRAVAQSLVLAGPVLLMAVWRNSDHVTGQTGDWFNWQAKANWVLMMLRDRWQLFDIASVAILFAILFKGLRNPVIGYSRHLVLSAIFLLAVYLVLPRIIFGSAYADMRLAPFAMAVALVALRPKPGSEQRRAALWAALGLAFVLVRFGAQTWSYWLYDRSYDRQLAALEKLPEGARLVTLIGENCVNDWPMTRLQHVAGIATVRKRAYTNDQWSMPGAQLLTVRYRAAAGFAHDPSQIVTPDMCPFEWWRPVAVALTAFPRDAFDYVWLVNPPAYAPRLEQGLTPLWRDGRSALFRVDRDMPGAVLSGEDWPGYRKYLERRRRMIERLRQRQAREARD